MGTSVFELIKTRSYRLRRAIQSAVEERASSEHEVICEDEGGARLYLSNRVSPVEHDGATQFVLMFSLDNTEAHALKQLAEAGRMQSIHMSKMAFLGEMAGGIAHEINTPLAVIHTLTEVVKELATEDNFDPAEVVDSCGQMEEAVVRISKIVTGLRAFARYGSMEPLRLCDAKKMIADAVDLCQEKFKKSNTDLRVEIEDQHLAVKCRSVEISQVLLNLLNNAHSAVNGCQERWVRVSSRSFGSVKEISVSDSGPRISRAVQEKIFQPFFTTRRIGEGVGLGLSISKGLIESNGGTLTFDEKSECTRFVIRFDE